MIMGTKCVALMLFLAVTVSGKDIHSSKHPEEEDEHPSLRLPEKGAWAHADQEEMPMKGHKNVALGGSSEAHVPDKKTKKEVTSETAKIEDDDADDDVNLQQKGAPSPAPLEKEVPHAPIEDDADQSQTPELMAAIETGAESQASGLAKHEAEHEALFSLFSGKQMALDEFDQIIEKYTAPLRERLIAKIDEHDSKRDATKDPMMKTYLELFEPEKYKLMYGDMPVREPMLMEHFSPEKTILALQSGAFQWEDDETEEQEEEKIDHVDYDHLQKELDTFNQNQEQVKENYDKLMQDYKVIEVGDEEATEEKKKSDEAIKEGKFTGNEDTGNEDSEEDIEAAHDQLIKKESAHKEEKTNAAVRTAAIVDAKGNMMFEKEPKDSTELKEKSPKTLRQAEDEDDSSRAAEINEPDADTTKPSPKPKGVYDPEYTSPEDKERQAEADKRSRWLSILAGVVCMLVLAWLFIRHRAQQMIERSNAFDDASSVSSSTMTEENPTVKVNRALLERMANISQKLSEKVEEARASSNSGPSDVSSEGSSRQYTRKKKDQLLA